MPERDAVRATDMEMTICRLLVVIVVLGTTTVSQANNERQYLRIGAFNAKTFGRTKMSNPQNRDYFRQIVERYDVLLIQEVRDSTRLIFVISQPLGRSSYKEQYAFFYRKDRVIIFDQSQYADQQDVFEREPFSVLMAAMWSCTDNDEMSHGTSDRLVLTGFHSTPRDATAEIGHLRDVLDNLRRQFGVQTVVMGDLNADCRYSDNDDRVRAGDYLTTSTNYTWLIGDDIDTTTSNTTHCAYDRIIIPSALATQVVSGSATAFHFGDYLQLSAAQALMISDHFPVEMLLAM
ncbi:hypothetical protein BaRGS_00019804 [Batillaria attramentaria]|uniref:Deoxyribonuclease n=1 Tax=Batillaria attramentaria TaxID=370345 RepID=A0ABD0KP36_9CAEN